MTALLIKETEPKPQFWGIRDRRAQRKGWRVWEFQADVTLNPKHKGNYMLHIMQFIVSAFFFDAHTVILCQIFFFLHLGFRVEGDKDRPCQDLEDKVKILCVALPSALPKEAKDS